MPIIFLLLNGVSWNIEIVYHIQLKLCHISPVAKNLLDYHGLLPESGLENSENQSQNLVDSTAWDCFIFVSIIYLVSSTLIEIIKKQEFSEKWIGFFLFSQSPYSRIVFVRHKSVEFDSSHSWKLQSQTTTRKMIISQSPRILSCRLDG